MTDPSRLGGPHVPRRPNVLRWPSGPIRRGVPMFPIRQDGPTAPIRPACPTWPTVPVHPTAPELLSVLTRSTVPGGVHPVYRSHEGADHQGVSTLPSRRVYR